MAISLCNGVTRPVGDSLSLPLCDLYLLRMLLSETDPPSNSRLAPGGHTSLGAFASSAGHSRAGRENVNRSSPCIKMLEQARWVGPDVWDPQRQDGRIAR